MPTRNAYAIVRIDRLQMSEEARVTVKRVVWDLDTAEAEAQRLLNAANNDKGCFYFAQSDAGRGAGRDPQLTSADQASLKGEQRPHAAGDRRLGQRRARRAPPAR